MLLADMVVRTVERALGVAEVALCGVCRRQPPGLLVLARVLFVLVVDGIMRRKGLAGL